MFSAVEVVLYQSAELHAHMMKPTAEELLKKYITCLDSQFSRIDDHSSFAGEGAAQEQPKESFSFYCLLFHNGLSDVAAK